MNDEIQSTTDYILSFSSFAIYGAQVVAYGAYTALRQLIKKSPECFLVSKLNGNLSQIDGIDVREISTADLDKSNVLIIVAVTELLQAEVAESLKCQGYLNVFLLGAHEEHLLMAAYFDSIGRFPLLETSDKQHRDMDLGVYVVSNHRDTPLRNVPVLFDWEIPIQAGTALTDVRLADITDDVGDNISAKNRQYSEMTATYWVWKNIKRDWKGICHYRRHLIMTPSQLSALSENAADVVLPLPYLCYPNTLAQFGRFVTATVQELLLETLRLLHPNEFERYLKILNGHYQYTYNLLCARSEVFDRYCEWLFPIEAHMETYADKAPEIGNTRALSYVAEVLTSLYFLSNEENYTIRHVEKRIYA